MDIRYLIDDIIHHHESAQEIINRRFRSKNKFILNIDDYKMLVKNNGVKVYTSMDLQTLADVYEDYIYSDIKPSDTVFDIGANIGGFTLDAALIAKRVIALEPIRYTELTKNIYLNGFTNVIAINKALSDDPVAKIWWDKWHEVPGISFKDLITSFGPCDFLKCDSEGGEWAIPFDELIKIPRIEMETHKVTGWDKHLAEKLSKTHMVTTTPQSGLAHQIIHARIK